LVLDRKITSHGLRSFYVTARRSQSIGDAQIAAEIGDRTGPAIISRTYGDIPPNWQAGGAAIQWVPDGASPAWHRFAPRQREVGMPDGMQPSLVAL